MTQSYPSDRVATNTATAADLAMFDQARAESRDDLANLRAAFGKAVDKHGETVAVSNFVQAILDSADWTRLHLATVLVEALAATPIPPQAVTHA